MADPTKLTFGCGEFIPGAGPFGFPDYVPSPGVDGPDDGGGPDDPDPGEGCDPPCPEGQFCNAFNVCEDIVDPPPPDPCDNVNCFQITGDTCKTKCVDGICGCKDEPCLDQNSGCFIPSLDCNCYPGGPGAGSTTTYFTETQVCYRTTKVYSQDCLTQTQISVAGDNIAANYKSDITNGFKLVAGVPYGPCGTCPGGPGTSPCGPVTLQRILCADKPDGPGGTDPILGGTRLPGEGNVELSQPQIDALEEYGSPPDGSLPVTAESQEPSSNNQTTSLFQSVTNSVKSAFSFVNSFANVKKPSEYALEDYEITAPKGVPEKNFTNNTVGYKNILNDRIHKSINTILSIGDSFDTWESKTLSKLNAQYIIGSMQTDLYIKFKSITKTDGSKYSDRDIANILMSKIVDGTLGDLDVNRLDNLSTVTNIYKKQQITPSQSSFINEAAALNLIEQTMIPMTPTSPGITTKIMDNWKTFATDLNKYVEIEIAGVKQKYYINDDDTVVDFPKYKISDGDVLKVSIGGRRYNLPVKSEKSRAYVVPEPARQQALTLLRGNPARTLYVDVDTSANVDFNYSLNTDGDADRQNAYFFKLIPSSTTKTNDNPSTDIITTTEGKYELMDSTTEAGIAEINEYIKYKYNHRSVFLPHDDIIFDYIESASSINMIQQDVLPPQSKDNPDFPLLVRDYPWYLIVVPTNRSDYLESNAKSRIVSYNVEGKNRRQITTKPLIDPGFVTQKSPLFTKTNLSTTNTNVYGNRDVQGRQTEFSVDQDIYKTVYRDSNGTYGRPSEVRLRRKKNGFRIIKEILDELNTNYILGSNPREKTIYKNDLISRMNMREYNLFFGYENPSYLYSLIEKGLFNDIKIVPTSRRKESALRLSPKSKTRLIKRRGAASTIDKFPIIKSTNSGRYLENPDQDTLYSARFRDRDQSDIKSRGESSRNS